MYPDTSSRLDTSGFDCLNPAAHGGECDCGTTAREEAAEASQRAEDASGYQPRPVAEVTTQDLIATIAADRNCEATFEARRAYSARTGQPWSAYAPAKPRARIVPDLVNGLSCGPLDWHSFVESGRL